MSRSNASGMEFEWENRHGPMDAASPFVSLAANSQRQQGEQKRSFASFENKTNSFPTLRPATGTHMLFSQPLQKLQKELPPPPLNKNPAFNTPRKLEPDYNDSSGVENTSPENNADSEATPDNMGWRSKITKIKSSVTNFAEKNSQKNNAVFSHGGTDSPKAGSLQPFYSLNIEKRRKKKSEKDKRLALRKNSSASDSEDTTKGKDRRNANITAVPAGPGQLASLFGFIECHPNLPHILSFYAQLLLNFFLVFLFIYMVYCFWSTIRSDIDKKSEEAMTDILAEMAICAQNYRENRCDPSTRMPALETICNNWERCMNRDPRALGRAKVSAHTFAEIFNSFIEPISYKAMIFTSVLIFSCVTVSNFAFGFYRNHAPPPPPPSAYMQTPMRHYSGPQDVYWNNPQSPMLHDPAPSMGALGAQTPVRRLQY